MDIINLLPDSVANQIAAGEVIQRPASVVKEFIENSIDAGSTSIKIITKDSGKSLIQVIDNGCGMSETDARMAFERHATSKINKASDLFAIHTMGFRGEALASIAAIAQVELKTKTHENELGTKITIHGSELISHDAISCSNGSNFLVKNIFYNIPVRRKFLKTNSTELKHIINEVYRVALANPEIEFSFSNNNTELIKTYSSKLRQRIISLFGKSINQHLITIKVETSVVKIYGYIGKPEKAKKIGGEQYFFVNKRFMRSPYYHKAIMLSYEKILSPGMYPSYFLFFELNPNAIDINIHPTKTEIKFENAQAVFQILKSAITESLGKFNIVPSIDFDTQGQIEIPVSSEKYNVKPPEVNINYSYNPFKQKDSKNIENIEDWNKLYSNIGETENEEKYVQSKFDNESETKVDSIQIKNRYILTPVKSGLMLIDQKRAFERITYEKLQESLKNNNQLSQKKIFPETIEFEMSDYLILKNISQELNKLGFDISEFGKNTFAINGSPAIVSNINSKELLYNILSSYKKYSLSPNEELIDYLAKSLAKSISINYNNSLKNKEIKELVDNLFACTLPKYSPSGKLIISIISIEDFQKMLN